MRLRRKREEAYDEGFADGVLFAGEELRLYEDVWWRRHKHEHRPEYQGAPCQTCDDMEAGWQARRSSINVYVPFPAEASQGGSDE